MVRHNINISEPRQYFLKEGPLAILPINEKNFSFVWSVSNKLKTINTKDLVYNKLKEILTLSKKKNMVRGCSLPTDLKTLGIFSRTEFPCWRIVLCFLWFSPLNFTGLFFCPEMLPLPAPTDCSQIPT